ncbi:MAG: UDP-N-acetylmuramate dehydrogenase [Oscillospiraceae bacterium]|nr:UDP-N-acetylmuramate dehydrogenase [Oscillospiraceae bacterium]
MHKTDILAKYCKERGCAFKMGESLSDYTSFKIGGTADIIVFPENSGSLAGLMGAIKENGLDFILLGNGSNVLLCENHFSGAAVVTSHMDAITVEGETIYAQCGVSLNTTALAAKAHSLSGLEFAYGIPGTLGGAVYMNAGAYGGQIGDAVSSSCCLDMDTLETKNLDFAGHEFAYRESVYGKNRNFILLSAVLSLKRGDTAEIETAMNKNMAERKLKQPLEYPSAGSVFKRGSNYFAAKLINDCGLKGCSVGGAQVSQKHAGFIINKKDASFSDVTGLIAHIKSVVFELTGIKIECEIKIMEW